MHRATHILAHTASILLHPLLMPMYGMLLLCAHIYFLQDQQNIQQVFSIYSGMIILGTFLLTLFIPAGTILLMWKLKHIDSLHIADPKQRTAPYLFTILSYAVWTYFLHAILHLPPVITRIAIGAIIALVAVTIINLWWKISAHLTGIGGLLGGVCSYALCSSQMLTPTMAIILFIALLLMYARIYLDAHTPLQVVCGLLLGLLSTFLPNLIIYA